MSHECLHCEKVRGDMQEPRIIDAAILRRAGQALRMWCGDVEELSKEGNIGEREHWENAGMLLGLLVKLITSAPYATKHCAEAAAVRMRYHADLMMVRMLDLPRSDGLQTSDAPGLIGNTGPGAFICPEEDFAKTAMSLVQGLVELLPALLGQLPLMIE